MPHAQHALPELSSKFGFMRSRASWVFNQFAKSVFANGKVCTSLHRGAAFTVFAPSAYRVDPCQAAQPEQFGQVFRKVMDCMSDSELPVRVQVAPHLCVIVRRYSKVVPRLGFALASLG